MADEDDFPYRFGGIQRLYGAAGSAKLRQAHVCVIGIGGVGSWSVEALARTGIGQLTLVDWDDICVTNVNRQIHAMNGSLGKPKIDVIAERVAAIQPQCTVNLRREFFNAETAADILAPQYDFVLDAIDNAKEKCRLIGACRDQNLPLITVGGAGGRIDPGAIAVDDLSRSYNDPLLAQVRKRLRKDYGFPRDERHPFEVDCVYSPEAVRYPQEDGSVCTTRHISGKMRLDCESGFGTASFITGAFGFAAAARVCNRIAAANA
ncbi:MAG: tRNA A37 threonylcarbamoyladenosine dehydratase [Rhodothermales bacterium]|jgi:tRNA A37 threonylcarbamoyladenosine dehydratase